MSPRPIEGNDSWQFLESRLYSSDRGSLRRLPILRAARTLSRFHPSEIPTVVEGSEVL